jgi:hypothetical protein
MTENPLMEKKFCPFCLEYDFNYKFMQTTKSRKPSKMCECPNCKERFRLQSFHDINKMSITEFAVWVAEYALLGHKQGFWSKVKNAEQWIQRMRMSGNGKEFWEKYREIKPKQLSQEEENAKWDSENKQ